MGSDDDDDAEGREMRKGGVVVNTGGRVTNGILLSQKKRARIYLV